MVSQELGDNDSLDCHLENVGPKPSITGGKLEGSIVESRLFSPLSCLHLPLGCFRCSCFAHDHSVLRFLRGCLQYWRRPSFPRDSAFVVFCRQLSLGLWVLSLRELCLQILELHAKCGERCRGQGRRRG